MGMRRVMFLLLFLPGITQASIGSDINGLINRFFGSGQVPVESAREVETEVVESEHSADFEFVEKEPTEIREEILFEEATLAQFEDRISQEENQLWNLQQAKNTAQNQLFLLDEQVGINTQRLSRYQTLEKRWRASLEDITRRKSAIKALLRVRDREHSSFLSKNFVRNEVFSAEDSVPVWEWLFSRKTVAQILADKARDKDLVSAQKNDLSRLRTLRSDLEIEEKNAALLYSRMTDLKAQVALEKIKLNDLAAAKARLVARSEASEDELEFSLTTARAEQAESTIYLQNLRQSLRESEDTSSTTPEVQVETEEVLPPPKVSLFRWPLPLPIKITAEFKDEDYKQAFGREHDGLDLFASQGTDVLAPLEGEVSKVASNGFGYSYIVLKHERDFYTVYGHVSKILVKPGDLVTTGQVIAQSGGLPGSRGAGFFTTGPHLHFEVFRDGQFLDPLLFLPEIR